MSIYPVCAGFHRQAGIISLQWGKIIPGKGALGLRREVGAVRELQVSGSALIVFLQTYNDVDVVVAAAGPAAAVLLPGLRYIIQVDPSLHGNRAVCCVYSGLILDSSL